MLRDSRFERVREMRAVVKFTIKLFHFLRNPLNRPLEPLLWVASTISAKRAFSKRTTTTTTTTSSLEQRLKKNKLFPFVVVLVQAKVDGTRWQVFPAYLGTGLTVLVDTLDGKLRINIPSVVRKTTAVIGFATAFSSVFAGLFIPVFRMPKATGPHKVGKRRFYWQDMTRKSWIRPDHPKRKKLPEHRKLMADIWYPAELEEKMRAMDKKNNNKNNKNNNTKNNKNSKNNKRKKINWLDPDLARALAISFWAPGWVVNYFRLVRMDATDSPDVATEPHPEGSYADEITGKFPIVVFSHSFSGMKEQNSALLQELASWGHICVAADHPHDAALVLYPDGSSADFRGYDQPEEERPKMWWKFRNRHLKYRALDLQFVLDRLLELNEDKEDALYNTMDDTRIAAFGHSFGGAASGMFAQLDKRVTSVMMLDPWMWPMGRSVIQKGIPAPLMIFEAPRFLGNRDIFCIENDYSSNMLALATAPQCAKIDDRSIDSPSSLPQPQAIDFDLSRSSPQKLINEEYFANDDGGGLSMDETTKSGFGGRPPLPPINLTSPSLLAQGENYHSRSNSYLNNVMLKHSFSNVSIADSLADSEYEFFVRNSRGDHYEEGENIKPFEYAAPSGICYKAVLEETMHFDYTDLAMVAPITTRLLGMIAVGGSEVHDVISRASLRFLYAHNHPRRKHENFVSSANANVHVYEYDADTLNQRTRMLHPGPWPGCPADEKDIMEIIEKKKKNMKKMNEKKNNFSSSNNSSSVDSAMTFDNRAKDSSKNQDSPSPVPLSPRIDIIKNLTPFNKVREAILEAETDERWKNKGGFVRWIDLEEFANEREEMGDERPWTDEQLREVRWLLSETEEKSDFFILKRSDWIAMFPNRSEREIRKALEIIENDATEHSPPRKLTWLMGENPDVVIEGRDSTFTDESSDDDDDKRDRPHSPRFLLGSGSNHVVKPRPIIRVDSSLRP